MDRNSNHQDELGAFLRARRSELSPSDVGLPEGGTQRRVAGLRREEVAQLAAISIDYYTRLEQGRVSPSAPVLAAVGRVVVGEVTLDWDPLTSDADPDQQIIIFTAEPGSRFEQALQGLAAWAAHAVPAHA